MKNQLTTTAAKIKLSEMGTTGLVQYVCAKRVSRRRPMKSATEAAEKRLMKTQKTKSADSVRCTEWVERAKRVLQEKGRMKAKDLAAEVGGGCSARSLSMLLQWEQGRNGTVEYSGGRWARSTAEVSHGYAEKKP